MKKALLSLMVVLSAGALRAQAQDGISQLLKTAPGDANKLLSAYADPLFKGFGVGLNSGWTNTAKTKGLLHFELRVSASGAFVPNSDKSFDVTKIGLSSSVRPVSGSPTITPTIAGNKNATPATLAIYGNQAGFEAEVDRFTLPERVMPIIPAPQIQLTAGLIHNTDVTLRFIPKTKITDDVGSVGMIGIGFKHDIMQDLAGGLAGRLIPFNLAIAAGYTRLNYELPLEVRPSSGRVPDAQSAQKTDFSNQRLEGHFNGLNIQAIISKKLAFFTPFAAVGYNTAKTDIGLIGNYPVTNGLTTYTVYTNPITINKNSISSFRVDGGFQLDLAVFKFYASGSLGEYKSATVGLGLGL